MSKNNKNRSTDFRAVLNEQTPVSNEQIVEETPTEETTVDTTPTVPELEESVENVVVETPSETKTEDVKSEKVVEQPKTVKEEPKPTTSMTLNDLVTVTYTGKHGKRKCTIRVSNIIDNLKIDAIGTNIYFEDPGKAIEFINFIQTNKVMKPLLTEYAVKRLKVVNRLK